MTILDRLERRFGRFAVPNLTLLLIVGQVAIYILTEPQRLAGQVSPLLEKIWLVPNSVLDGEVWRLLTFLVYPPVTNLIFAFFFWYLFYLMGSSLEVTWGAFRYNLFLLVGYLASVAAAFLDPNQLATNGFLYGSVFFAFARLFPDFVIQLFFILPIKVRWLALVGWLVVGFSFLRVDASERVLIVAAVLNYILFFWRDHYREIKDYQRRKSFAAKAAPKIKSGRLVHTCRTCGLTSDDDPKTSFRYCSQCAGQVCYCPDHIRDHEHVAE